MSLFCTSKGACDSLVTSGTQKVQGHRKQTGLERAGRSPLERGLREALWREVLSKEAG